MDMRQLRERSGLTQAELAVALGIDPVTIRNWEAGRSHPTLQPQGYRKLLEALKTTPVELEQAVEATKPQPRLELLIAWRSPLLKKIFHGLRLVLGMDILRSHPLFSAAVAYQKSVALPANSIALSSV